MNGYNNRYYYKREDLSKELHPGVAGSIYIDNKKSLAFTLYFEDANKTLTLDEVLDIFNKFETLFNLYIFF